MKIETYTFGHMTVDGKTYSKDLILFPDRVMTHWWRTAGHRLGEEDLTEIMKAKPAMLIVGTGAQGCLDVPLATRAAIKEEGIELFAEKTDKAVQLFNRQIESGKNVAGAFHLTC